MGPRSSSVNRRGRRPPAPNPSRLSALPFRTIFVIASNDGRELRQPGLAPSGPQLVAGLPQPRLVERTGVKVYLIGYFVVGIHRRAAGSAGVSAAVLGTFEHRHISGDGHCVAWEHDIK